MQIQRGQKVKLDNITQLECFVRWSTPKKQMELDISSFLLQAGNRCEKDEHFIFYGQPNSPDKSVSYAKQTPLDGSIFVQLNVVPEAIEKIAISLSIHEGDAQNLRFQEVDKLELLIRDAAGATLYTYAFGDDLQQETAIVVGELYRHQGQWKFSVIGSGFNGGLEALCLNYGLEIEQGASDIKSDPTPPVKASAEEKPKPNLQKMNINLKKKESVSIAKSNKIVATLEWANPKKDLDLYCFYVLKNGESGKVYYRSLGHANRAPFITLDGDSRVAGKETIVIHDPSKLKYVLFASYSAVSNGFGSFKSMKAQAVVDNQMGQRITSPLYEKNHFAYWVAIAHIDFTDANNISVSHVERYSKSGSERSPELYADGLFEMDRGVIEFK
ncbi:TerD family protein [Psychrobacillus sp. NEAU-3TGS]|uniref:TerD family protein n=1 Tax=Psychrobacillus sp. NEAU-3TGS TaxID=2995412 RepID=UPI002498140D|nr:TerD family protein [Psychrobacillus sp. NEAU-3TGS]MDI2585613.1 TerD family protein [Psychrobacillus sp. NEAU-3TGS]